MMVPPSPFLHPQVQVALADEAATLALGHALAAACCGGDLIRLEGDLGAGKSTLARGIIQALGHTGDVPSPTYTVMQVYDTTRFPLAHVDCYRLQDPAELAALGLEDFRRFGVVLAEWPDRGGASLAMGGDLLPYHINSIENPGVLTVTLTTNGPGRRATLHGSPSWQRRWALMASRGVTFDRPVARVGGDGHLREDFVRRAGYERFSLTPMGGDWSGRSYARVTFANGTTRMLMDAPPPQESVDAYAQVADYYRSLGLRTAAIEARDDAQGFLLTEDLGDTTLWHLLQDGTPHTDWYMAAGDVLMAQCRAHAAGNTPTWARRYTPTDFWVEAMRVVNWLAPYATGHATALEDYATWQRLWAPHYATLMALPQGLMMWDCQSPNLMMTGPAPTLHNLALIDHQDARIASVAQDAALLLRNIRTPRDDMREAAVLDALAHGLAVDRAALQQAVEVAGLHHACRILGGLVRLHVRDGRSAPAQAYLARTWDVARQSFANPALRDIVAILETLEAPSLARLTKDTAHA